MWQGPSDMLSDPSSRSPWKQVLPSISFIGEEVEAQRG